MWFWVSLWLYLVGMLPVYIMSREGREMNKMEGKEVTISSVLMDVVTILLWPVFVTLGTLIGFVVGTMSRKNNREE